MMFTSTEYRVLYKKRCYKERNKTVNFHSKTLFLEAKSVVKQRTLCSQQMVQ